MCCIFFSRSFLSLRLLRSETRLSGRMVLDNGGPQPLVERAEATSARDISLIAYVLCSICLVWYTFILLVSALGYVQL